jgi:hypothetical protein
MVGDAMRPAAVVLAAMTGLGAVVAGIASLQGEASLADVGTWVTVVGLALPSTWAIAVPAAAVAAPVAAVAGWMDEGSWTGLAAAGRAGRRLVPGVLAVGLLAGAVTFGMVGWVDPTARRAAHRLVAASADHAALYPGITAVIDGVTVRPAAVVDGVAEDVFLADDGAVGTARKLSVQDGQLVLEDGRIARTSGVPWRVGFRRWTRPLPAGGRERVELSERTNPDLAVFVAREGDRDRGYERAVWLKRYVHPLVTAVAPCALLPLAAAARPLLAIGAAGVGYLVAVRLGDQLAGVAGPALAAATGPIYVAVVGGVAWARWRDR